MKSNSIVRNVRLSIISNLGIYTIDQIKKIVEDYMCRNKTSFSHIIKKDIGFDIWLVSCDDKLLFDSNLAEMFKSFSNSIDKIYVDYNISMTLER